MFYSESHIYAHELFPLGYGYPLWCPDPTPSSREIEIGDVGRPDLNGRWLPLFNTMKPPDDQVNRHGVPSDFKMLDPQDIPVSTTPKIMQAMVCSRNIDPTDNFGSGSASLPESAVVTFKFKLPSSSSAFVLLDAPALSTYVCSAPARRRMVTYMRDNFQGWIDFVFDCNIDLEDSDIMFICGTQKTTRWAVAAFDADQSDECYVTSDFGQFEYRLTINFGALHRGRFRKACYKCGPRYRRSDMAASPLPRPNQCLFLHY
ncbi:hypothetical protein OH76DRAFT_1366549 [Lentinus brumalis]|uniref:Uncharacterized protein n=1 Tax=Lentinus brumalis TaxID=2498619 RepID=A0A371CIV6_9APHY|nr:hypothetical protein OH76DRAFT_1366549 [Polyporus brumalis]